MRPYLVLLAFLVLMVPNVSADVWYVDIDNTSGTENGETWDSAFTTIQPAIDAAYDGGDNDDIWAAQLGESSWVDSDGDGLSDDDEVNVYGTDPMDPDTDNDGLSDGEEVNGAYGYVTDPTDDDSDDNGFIDGLEVTARTNPLDDADYTSAGAGLGICVLFYPTDAGVGDPLTLTLFVDGVETDLKHLNIWDVDMWDWPGEPAVIDELTADMLDAEGWHIEWGEGWECFSTDDYDPPFEGTFADAIAQGGFGDAGCQFWLDSDGDVMPDDWEVENGLDPNDDGTTDIDNGPFGDPDGDSLTNGGEWSYGTQANNVDSDDDGLTDGEEVYDWRTDPANEDTDSDGLSDYDEVSIHGTDPNDRDSDGDGMPDDWEVANSLDPTVPDGDEDHDDDGLPNGYEYQIETNPIDETDPPSDLYIATDGDDDEGLGTPAAPWFTIAHAMAAASIYSAAHSAGIYHHPETIHLAEGIYEERVTLVPDVTLIGAEASTTRIQHFDASDDSHTVVRAAQQTRLQDCTITLPGMHADVAVLLEIEDVVIDVTDCILDGADNPNSIGLLISGVNSSDSVIRDCTIRRLEDGIHAVDTGVNIANNLFEGIHDTAVFVRLPEILSKAVPEVPMLGNATAAGTGFNRFRSVMGNFIANMNPVEVLAESNDWGVYAAPQIAGRLFGAVDFYPYLTEAYEAPPPVPGDVNETGEVDAQDVQLVINEALGLDTQLDCDLDGNGYVDAVDVQLVINAVLGFL